MARKKKQEEEVQETQELGGEQEAGATEKNPRGIQIDVPEAILREVDEFCAQRKAFPAKFVRQTVKDAFTAAGAAAVQGNIVELVKQASGFGE